MGNAFARTTVMLLIAAWIYAASTHSGTPPNPLSRTEVPSLASGVATASASTSSAAEDPPEAAQAAFVEELEAISEGIVASIKDYVDIPKGGMDWRLFGQTKHRPYSYNDKDGRTWSGVRPAFPDQLKKHDGKAILIKGFMFPLGQQEKQSRFLLSPFPVSCPFHYEVTPNLLIEVHADKPVAFSYDAVSVKGRLELVPKDDEYNVFYRLKEAERVP